MSIYRRDDVFPEWEPVPWGMRGEVADRQERGFHERALKQIRWTPIPWEAFPPEGIFGMHLDWFRSLDGEFTARADDEDLLLIQNTWHGFPDPPEWGLASKSSAATDRRWTHWGHFPDLPKAWSVPFPSKR